MWLMATASSSRKVCCLSETTPKTTFQLNQPAAIVKLKYSETQLNERAVWIKQLVLNMSKGNKARQTPLNWGRQERQHKQTKLII